MALRTAPLRKRHFRLGRQLARSYIRHLRGVPRNGRSGPPATIHLQPTLACNLSCRMCIQNGPAGYLEKGDPLIKAKLPIEEYEKFLARAARHGPFVHVWGGEPLLYKHIDELVDLIRRMNLTVMLTTNAVRGLDHLDTLMKLDVLRISIDGPAEVHDEVRGRPKTFQAVIDLIRRVHEERKRTRSFWPRIVTNTLMIDQTWSHLEETVEILDGLPVDRCDLSLPMFTTKERGEAYEKILKKEWNSPAHTWKGFMIEGLTVDIDELIASLTRVRKNYSRSKFSLFPIGSIDGVRDWYDRLNKTYGFNKCRAATDNINILPNGDAVFCNDLPDLVIGNITQNSFEEIWNGETARSFRLRLEKGLLPVCSRCCLLYTFPMLKAAYQQRSLR